MFERQRDSRDPGEIDGAWPPVVAALAALAVALAVAWYDGVPAPAFQDEFAYVLSAETFAAGRLSNPTPPASESLATFHVIFEPTYSAKYPPGQGAALALGLLAGSDPILGVWLSFALAAAAITWMLDGWLPGGFALLGGLLCVVQLGVESYWTQSYWGGCVAAAGGALVLGALPRLRLAPSVGSATLLAVGLVLLANTRPLEGLLVALVTAGFLIVDRQARTSWMRAPGRWRVILPVVLIGSAALGAMALHNRAVTGSAVTFPYSVYEEQRNPYPLFLWGQVRELGEEQPRVFRELYDVWLRATFERQQTLRGWLSFKADRFWDAGALLLGPLLAGALGLALFSRRRRALGLGLFVVLVVCGVLLCTVSFRVQYLAPAYGALWLLVMLGVERGWQLVSPRVPRTHRRRAALLGAALLLAASFGLRLLYSDPRLDIAERRTATQQRIELTEQLLTQGGRHLVFVDARPPYSPHDEWVYNAPDPSAASIVWARFLDRAQNEAAIDAYPGRTAWRVELGVGAVENIGLYRYEEPSDWR